MLAGKMQFIPSVQLSRSPHSPDASVQQLRWHIEKRASRCVYERVAAVYVLLASLQTGSYLYQRRRCSHTFIPTTSFSYFWFRLKLKELISCVFRHLMGVKDLRLQPRTKLVPTTEPLCLPINRRPGPARLVSLKSISVVISHLLAVLVGDRTVLRVMSKVAETVLKCLTCSFLANVS